MKRNWIWGFCATMIAGGAFAFAQQEGAGTAPTANPVSGTTAPIQEVAPAGAASGPAEAFNLTAPTTGANTSAAGSDPFGGSPRIGGQGSSAETNGAAPITTDSGPEKTGNGSRNFGSAFGGGGGGGKAAANSFAPVSGGFGQQGNAFGGQMGRGGSMTMAGQNMSNMMMSKEAREYRDAENSVVQIAARLQHAPKDDPAADKLKEELKAAITKAFEARQAQQAAEVKRLKDKLAEIEAHVSRREKAKEVLIDERMYELTTGGGQSFGGQPFGGMGAFSDSTTTSTIPSSNFPAGSPAKANNSPASAPTTIQVR